MLPFFFLVATGFPSGQMELSSRLDEIRQAVKDGAREIDIVINRTLALQGNWEGGDSNLNSYLCHILVF